MWMINEVYDINQILLDDELYKSTKLNLISDLENRDDIIVVEDGQKKYKMTKANLLTNLIILRPFNVFKKPFRKITKDFLINANKFTKAMLSDYFNKVIDYFDDVDFIELNEVISSVIEELADLSGEINVRVGNTVSLHGIIELIEKCPEVYDLINTTIPDKLQFDEIEEYVKDQVSKLVKVLSAYNNVFSNYINSRTGINIKQLGQSIVNIGLKPDLYGNVISDPINTNYLQGLRDVKDFYINAIGTRKALITNFNKVKESGYLTRKLSLLMIDTLLDYDNEDCGSHHYIKAKIESKDTLKRLEGRWYINGDELNMINSETDLHLIGQTIEIRSPITCLGRKICRTCYGDKLAKLNKNLHVGILAVLFLTNQLTQMLLSSKHLLQTQSSKINWQKEFLEYFTVDRHMILFNGVADNSVMIIDTEDIEDGENASIKSFRIKQGRSIKKIESEIDLIITKELDKKIHDNKHNDGYSYIPLKNIKADTVLFNIVMENNELSASLQGILDLIETNHHLGLTDINDIYNKFITLLNESGIRINSVHIELILRTLIRDIMNETKRPDFTQDEFPEYKILRVTDAVIKSESVSVGLVFEQLKRQLVNPEIYNKSGYSIIDDWL